MLFDPLKKAREQTKVSLLQQAMRLFRTHAGSQPEQNKEDLPVTRSKNSPESK